MISFNFSGILSRGIHFWQDSNMAGFGFGGIQVWWNSYSKVVIAKRSIKDVNGFPQGAVPIVMGGLSERDYSRLAPPNSYLHVDQFEGPEHLAAKVSTFQT